MTEPVIVGLAPALITALVVALANLGRAFGVDINQVQIDAINAAVVPVMLVLVAVGAWWARSKSTPVDAPKLETGTVVTVTDPSPSVPDTKTVV